MSKNKDKGDPFLAWFGSNKETYDGRNTDTDYSAVAKTSDGDYALNEWDTQGKDEHRWLGESEAQGWLKRNGH